MKIEISIKPYIGDIQCISCKDKAYSKIIIINQPAEYNIYFCENCLSKFLDKIIEFYDTIFCKNCRFHYISNNNNEIFCTRRAERRMFEDVLARKLKPDDYYHDLYEKTEPFDTCCEGERK